MKVMIFCATGEDEKLYGKYKTEGLELHFSPETLTEANADLAKGMDAIVIQTRCIITPGLAAALKDLGVKEILTRSAGYDHMDLKAMKSLGLKGANVTTYSPNAIAEYAVTMTMMLLRKARLQHRKVQEGDFSLADIRGKEMRKQTVGVIGAGRIGFETIKILSGFGGRILVYDVKENEEISKLASYVPIDEIYEKSDVIIYHCPLLKENYHMLNDRVISKMKDGVVLVNPARGALWDYEAVYKRLSDGRIGAAGFDVFEGEEKYLRKHIERKDLPEVLQKLLELDNVIYTAHSAFYTDVAIENMVEVTVKNLEEYAAGSVCSNELTGDDK